MAQSKPVTKRTQRPAKAAAATPSKGFTDAERAAMKERARELKADARRGAGGGSADGETDLLAKIAEMHESDRAMAERLHAIVKASAPELTPRRRPKRSSRRPAGIGGSLSRQPAPRS